MVNLFSVPLLLIYFLLWQKNVNRDLFFARWDLPYTTEVNFKSSHYHWRSYTKTHKRGNLDQMREEEFNGLLCIATRFFSSLQGRQYFLPSVQKKRRSVLRPHVNVSWMEVGGRRRRSPYISVGQTFTDKDKCSAEDFISHPDGWYFIFLKDTQETEQMAQFFIWSNTPTLWHTQGSRFTQ